MEAGAHFEVEQKFWVDDAERFASAVDSLPAKWRGTARQVDEYFSHPCRDFAASDEALRIRRIGGENRVTYKGPKLDLHTKTRREIELPLATGDAGYAGFFELLTSLGFRSVAKVSKSRRTAIVERAGREIVIALDSVDQVGTFAELEIEAAADELDAARAAIAALAQRLGLSRNERRSYLEMLLSAQGSA
jgi:adenylate cyclase class 2